MKGRWSMWHIVRDGEGRGIHSGAVADILCGGKYLRKDGFVTG